MRWNALCMMGFSPCHIPNRGLALLYWEKLKEVSSQNQIVWRWKKMLLWSATSKRRDDDISVWIDGQHQLHTSAIMGWDSSLENWINWFKTMFKPSRAAICRPHSPETRLWRHSYNWWSWQLFTGVQHAKISSDKWFVYQSRILIRISMQELAKKIL